LSHQGLAEVTFPLAAAVRINRISRPPSGRPIMHNRLAKMFLPTKST
jgi:hypothetical protein